MDRQRIIQEVDAWLDSAVADCYQGQPLAQDWARVGKVIEELGEAVTALIGWTGQNPRKGKTHVEGDMLAELADVQCTAILAIQHFTKSIEDTTSFVNDAWEKIAGRIPSNLTT